MIVSYKLRGFSNYLVTDCLNIIRVTHYTKHHHYKEPRFISPNKRNQYVLISDKGGKEYWTIKQLKNIFIKHELKFNTSCKIKLTPF